MDEIQVTARLTIHEGKLDDFKATAAACLQFFNKDQTVCVVRERYKNSEAVMEHMGNLGETLGTLLGLCTMSLEVYGSPSPALLKATDGMGIAFYSYMQGL